jgi:hypothetical protein
MPPETHRRIIRIDASSQALDALERCTWARASSRPVGHHQKKLELTSDGRASDPGQIGQLYETSPGRRRRSPYQASRRGRRRQIALRAHSTCATAGGRPRRHPRRQLTLIGPTTTRRHLELRFASAYARPPRRSPGAIDAYRDILDLEPGHPRARAALEAKLTDQKHQLAAAAILEPIYEQLGEWARLVGVHEIQHAASKDSAARARSAPARIGQLQRTRLSDASRRSTRMLARSRRTRRQAGQGSSGLAGCSTTAGRGWSSCSRPRWRGDPISLAHELATKVARSYEQRLGDSASAVVLPRARSRRARGPRRRPALGAIFDRDERFPELLEIYRAREIADPDEALDFLFRIASIHGRRC